MIIEKLLLGIGLAICVVLLVRLCLGARRQQRFDAAVRRTIQACRTGGLRIYRWRASKRQAASVAEQAIRRAREGAERSVERDGNVYRPQAFHRPRKPH